MSEILDSQNEKADDTKTAIDLDEIALDQNTDVPDEAMKQNSDDPTQPQWVSIHSAKYKKFIVKVEMNWESSSTKLSI